MTASEDIHPDAGPCEQDSDIRQQRFYSDLIVVLIVMLTTYLVAGYFDLAERYIDWTALGELYQLDEIVFVLLAGCLGLFWFSIRRLRELSLTLKRNLSMQQQLKDSNTDIRRLLRENQALINHMTQLREAERHHLASELHDVFGQHLAAMDANLTVAMHLAPQNSDNLRLVLQSVIGSTTHLRGLTRNKLRQLKPPALDSIGLSGAVRELISDWQQTFPDIVVSLNIELRDHQISNEISLTVYRALQEGLVNISRHAEASKVLIHLWQSQQDSAFALKLTLEDNGKGLTPEKQTPEQGLGLVGIRERSRALGGHFAIGNISPTGVRLTLSIPYQPMI